MSSPECSDVRLTPTTREKGASGGTPGESGEGTGPPIELPCPVSLSRVQWADVTSPILPAIKPSHKQLLTQKHHGVRCGQARTPASVRGPTAQAGVWPSLGILVQKNWGSQKI